MIDYSLLRLDFTCFDSPVLEHDGKVWDSSLASLYKHYDIYAQTTGWPEHLKHMENLGIKRALFLPQGCDTNVHRVVTTHTGRTEPIWQ